MSPPLAPKLVSLAIVFSNLKINTITYSITHESALEVKLLYCLSHTPVTTPSASLIDCNRRLYIESFFYLYIYGHQSSKKTSNFSYRL